jgi:DNA-binding IclR family transcriptional regulator
LDILELFASTQGGLTVSEAARMLNRTVSEIFRMLLCLEQRGYLSQSENREKYRLTLRLFRLAQEYPPTNRLITESLSLMHGVAHELRQSCHLGVLDGGHVVILTQVDTPESTGLHVKMGSKVELM